MVRKRQRYVTIEVDREDGWRGVGGNRSVLLTKALLSSIRNLYGVQGAAMAKAGLFVEFLGPESYLARVTMRRSAYKIVTSSLQFLTVVDGGKVLLRTLHTAATIRHANMFVTRYLRKQIENQLATAIPSESERQELEGLLKSSARKDLTKKTMPSTSGGKRLGPRARKAKLAILQKILSG